MVKDLRELDFKKTKNKIFKTSNFCNQCECGEVVTMELYKQMNLLDKTTKERLVGFCKCGNIFIADL